jgi:hypothetical protein
VTKQLALITMSDTVNLKKTVQKDTQKTTANQRIAGEKSVTKDTENCASIPQAAKD